MRDLAVLFSPSASDTNTIRTASRIRNGGPEPDPHRRDPWRDGERRLPGQRTIPGPNVSVSPLTAEGHESGADRGRGARNRRVKRSPSRSPASVGIRRVRKGA
jgi:hypothetical protein